MLKKFGYYAHTAYCMTVFGVSFIGIMPAFMLCMQRKKWHRHAYRLNYIWAKVNFFLWRMPITQVFEEPIDRRRQYIFCSNHFSFLDIPVLGLSPVSPVFIGKSSIGKVPLFGYMYRKLHITVDRESMKSRYETVLKARQAIEEGKSLAIFPEGGIVSKHPPKMGRFKDGAFRVAIEKQIPIIPVTIPFNWILLPDKWPLVLHRGKARVIYHRPIETKGMTLDDLPELKNSTYNIIEQELKKYSTDENRFTYA